MVPKGLEKGPEELEIRGRLETVQTTALLRSVAGPIRTSTRQIIFVVRVRKLTAGRQ